MKTTSVLDRRLIAEGVQAVMNTLPPVVSAELERRDLNASGAVNASMQTNTTQTPTSTTGTMLALDYWINVGSGTPPGSGVRESAILQWMEEKQFEGANIATAFFITRKINREGSLAYRQGLPNAFETAIDIWAKSTAFDTLDTVAENEYGKAYIDLLQKNLK